MFVVLSRVTKFFSHRRWLCWDVGLSELEEVDSLGFKPIAEEGWAQIELAAKDGILPLEKGENTIKS